MPVEIQETAAEACLVRALREIDTLLAGREAIEAYRVELDVRREAESLLDQQVEDLENACSAAQAAYEYALERERLGCVKMLELQTKLEESDRAFAEADARRASVQELLSKSILRGTEEMQRADAAARELASSQEGFRIATAECLKLEGLRANAESERDAAQDALQTEMASRERLDYEKIEHEKSDLALRVHRAELENSLGNALRERDEALHATSVLRGTVKSTVDGLTKEIHKLTVDLGAKNDALRVANDKMDEAERDNLLAIKMARWFEDCHRRAAGALSRLSAGQEMHNLVAYTFHTYLERWEQRQWPKAGETA